jgi:hypothetical protein
MQNDDKKVSAVKGWLARLFRPQRQKVEVGQIWDYESKEHNPFERTKEKLKILSVKDGYFKAQVVGFCDTKTGDFRWLKRYAKLSSSNK